jgi:DNA-binding NarL/FixJ family response regulator
MIRVLVVENQKITPKPTQLNIEKLLHQEDDLKIVGLATNGVEAITQVHQLHPDVVLMDIHMPLMDGQEAACHIRQQYPNCKILMLATFDQDDCIVNAFINIGVQGYLLKDRDMPQLAQSIRMAHQGYSQMSPGVLEKLRGKVTIAPPPTPEKEPDEVSSFQTLTLREQAILKAIAQGLNNREIAAVQFLSPSTVRNHISNMIDRLKLENRFQLRCYAEKVFAHRPQDVCK